MGVGMVPIMPDNLTTKFIILYLYVVICLYEFIMQGICIFSKESIQADILFYKYVKIFFGFFSFFCNYELFPVDDFHERKRAIYA